MIAAAGLSFAPAIAALGLDRLLGEGRREAFGVVMLSLAVVAGGRALFGYLPNAGGYSCRRLEKSYLDFSHTPANRARTPHHRIGELHISALDLLVDDRVRAGKEETPELAEFGRLGYFGRPRSIAAVAVPGGTSIMIAAKYEWAQGRGRCSATMAAHRDTKRPGGAPPEER